MSHAFFPTPRDNDLNCLLPLQPLLLENSILTIVSANELTFYFIRKREILRHEQSLLPTTKAPAAP